GKRACRSPEIPPQTAAGSGQQVFSQGRCSEYLKCVRCTIDGGLGVSKRDDTFQPQCLACCRNVLSQHLQAIRLKDQFLRASLWVFRLKITLQILKLLQPLLLTRGERGERHQIAVLRQGGESIDEFSGLTASKDIC